MMAGYEVVLTLLSFLIARIVFPAVIIFTIGTILSHKQNKAA